MIKNMVSVVIPARNEPYLKKTVEDLLKKSKEAIEILVVLDGYWPNIDEIIEDKRVIYLHYSTPRGMRNAINSAVRIASGEFILKCDAHCMFADGFDVVLKKDCEKDWIVVPRRYPLDPEKWDIEVRTDNKYPIDYMVLNATLQGIPAKGDDSKQIDDLMTSQGSCWFMRREYFDYLELLDEETYGTFWQEFQEIGLKCWLSGGRIVVNKGTWYAHWHKNEGRGYSLPQGEQESTRAMVNRWRTEKMFSKQIYELDWLFNKFNIK